MKNLINYYYNLNIDNLYFNNGKYYFNSGINKYVLEVCINYDNLSHYSDLKKSLDKYNYFFKIIINRNNQPITWIENKPYILLKISNIQNDKISIYDIKTDYYIDMNERLVRLNHYSWIKLWENKIDYLENWFYSKQESYQELYALFNYYIGVSENALLYLKETERNEYKEESDNLVVSHERININYELYEYYDPTNLIIDHPSRDVSEYIKSCFLYKVWDLDLIDDYLKKHYFSRYGIRVMLARILFPSFFYDYVEEMILKNETIDLLYLETRIDDYERFVRQISQLFLEKYNIPIIPWITKKT